MLKTAIDFIVALDTERKKSNHYGDEEQHENVVFDQGFSPAPRRFWQIFNTNSKNREDEFNKRLNKAELASIALAEPISDSKTDGSRRTSDLEDDQSQVSEVDLTEATESFRKFLRAVVDDASLKPEVPVITHKLYEIAVAIIQAAEKDGGGAMADDRRSSISPPLFSVGHNPEQLLVTRLSTQIKAAFRRADGHSDGYIPQMFARDFFHGGKDEVNFFDGELKKRAKECITCDDKQQPIIAKDASYEDVMRPILIQQQFAMVHACLIELPGLNFRYDGSASNMHLYYDRSYEDDDSVSIQCKVIFAERGVDLSIIRVTDQKELSIPPELKESFVGSMEYAYTFDKLKLDKVKDYMVEPTADVPVEIQSGCLRTIELTAIELHNMRKYNDLCEPDGPYPIQLKRTLVPMCTYTSRAFATSRAQSRTMTPVLSTQWLPDQFESPTPFPSVNLPGCGALTDDEDIWNELQGKPLQRRLTAKPNEIKTKNVGGVSVISSGATADSMPGYRSQGDSKELPMTEVFERFASEVGVDVAKRWDFAEYVRALGKYIKIDALIDLLPQSDLVYRPDLRKLAGYLKRLCGLYLDPRKLANFISRFQCFGEDVAFFMLAVLPGATEKQVVSFMRELFRNEFNNAYFASIARVLVQHDVIDLDKLVRCMQCNEYDSSDKHIIKLKIEDMVAIIKATFDEKEQNPVMLGDFMKYAVIPLGASAGNSAIGKATLEELTLFAKHFPRIATKNSLYVFARFAGLDQSECQQFVSENYTNPI